MRRMARMISVGVALVASRPSSARASADRAIDFAVRAKMPPPRESFLRS